MVIPLLTVAAIMALAFGAFAAVLISAKLVNVFTSSLVRRRASLLIV